MCICPLRDVCQAAAPRQQRHSPVRLRLWADWLQSSPAHAVAASPRFTRSLCVMRRAGASCPPWERTLFFSQTNAVILRLVTRPRCDRPAVAGGAAVPWAQPTVHAEGLSPPQLLMDELSRSPQQALGAFGDGIFFCEWITPQACPDYGAEQLPPPPGAMCWLCLGAVSVAA